MTTYARPATSATLSLVPTAAAPGCVERYNTPVLLTRTTSHTITTALDRVSGHEVIIKQAHSAEPAAQLRLACEGAMLRFLARHELLAPRFVELFEHNGYAHLVMTRVQGRTLGALHSAGQISAAQIVQLLCRLCQSVLRLHQLGYVHHDIKPPNILVRPDFTPVLIDWGAAAALRGRATPGGIGTVGFASPDQVRGLVRPTNDLFALGMTLDALIVRPAPRLSAIIDRAIAQHEPRYHSAAELGRDLAQLCLIERVASCLSLAAV